ncbi:MAG: SDR family oxidoreductase [Halieaceae bacterium]|nr:SDR family oxidoreductase [Halieaceae bacterium]
MTMENNNKPKRILITGATGGMGRECALLAADRGYDLLLADLSHDKLEELASDCARNGASVGHQVLDITEPSHKAQLVDALNSSPHLDGIIHTVGISPQMADWQKIFDVDLVQTVDLLEQTRPLMNEAACAVCIASSSGYMCPDDDEIEELLAEPGAADFSERLQLLATKKPQLENSGLAYSYAKKALSQYVARHARKWGQEQKRLVSLSPGLIDTAQGQREYKAAKSINTLKSHVTLGRLGEAREIATTALFLLSRDAAYITGCDILVDGGLIGSLTGGRKRQP